MKIFIGLRVNVSINEQSSRDAGCSQADYIDDDEMENIYHIISLMTPYVVGTILVFIFYQTRLYQIGTQLAEVECLVYGKLFYARENVLEDVHYQY